MGDHPVSDVAQRFKDDAYSVLTTAMSSMTDIIPTTREAQEAADILVSTGAYRVDLTLPRDRWYRWKSGIQAPCYCNCRDLNCHPHPRRRIDTALADAVHANFPSVEYVVGIASAGLPWAKSVADRLNLPLAYVRDIAKPHGVGGLVECSPERGLRAVLIDDLVASGESLTRVARALESEASMEVIGIQSIVNWNFPSMRSRLHGLVVQSLTGYPYILSSVLSLHQISEQECLQLLRFYQDPERHVWAQT